MTIMTAKFESPCHVAYADESGEQLHNKQGDYSNGGISSKVNNLTITNIGGPFEPTDDAPAAVLKSHVFGSAIVVPVDVPTGVAGPMAGGGWIASTDSRWGEALGVMGQKNTYIAVPLHDRFEKPFEYSLGGPRLSA